MGVPGPSQAKGPLGARLRSRGDSESQPGGGGLGAGQGLRPEEGMTAGSSAALGSVRDLTVGRGLVWGLDSGLGLEPSGPGPCPPPREAGCVWRPLCHQEAIGRKKLSQGQGPGHGAGGCLYRPVPVLRPRAPVRRAGRPGRVSAVRAGQRGSRRVLVVECVHTDAVNVCCWVDAPRGPVSGETDTACDQPPDPRPTHVTRDQAGLVLGLPSGEASGGRARLWAGQTQPLAWGARMTRACSPTRRVCQASGC